MKSSMLRAVLPRPRGAVTSARMSGYGRPLSSRSRNRTPSSHMVSSDSLAGAPGALDSRRNRILALGSSRPSMIDSSGRLRAGLEVVGQGLEVVQILRDHVIAAALARQTLRLQVVEVITAHSHIANASRHRV